MGENLKPVDWNHLEDPIDKQVWERLTANFWLDTKIPVSNDRDSWRSMSKAEQELVKKVFASLTALDTFQSETGAYKMSTHATTPHAAAVFSNIAFMESVHAKSYSTIFSTLCTSEEIKEIFRWAEEDELLQAQIATLRNKMVWGRTGAPFAASVLLESFLFYTGFYTPLRLAAEGKLTNTADIIRLIIRDEGVHGFYAGHQFKKSEMAESPEGLAQVEDLLHQLYEVEVKRVEQLYDELGWAEEVKQFLRYNANKALLNLGMDPIFDPETAEVPSYILSALDPSTGEAHDFFSGSGASYVVGTTEDTQSEDWDW